MNLKNMTAEQMDEFAFLPEEAIAALQAGEEWEHQPESIDGADTDTYYCDDCHTWHKVWSVFGLRLDRDGNLYETEWTVDSDGDWSFSDEHPYGEYDHSKAYEGVRARWMEYAQWVIRNESDPLGNFTRHERQEPEEFEVIVHPHGPDAVKVIAWAALPQRARDFLEMDDKGIIRVLGGFDEFKSRALNVTWTDRETFRFTLDAAPRASTSAEIVRRARAYVERVQEHMMRT